MINVRDHIISIDEITIDDQRGIVTMIDKPVKQTFNKTSTNENLGEEVIGTNYDNRPITRERKKEICEELGYRFD